MAAEPIVNWLLIWLLEALAQRLLPLRAAPLSLDMALLLAGRGGAGQRAQLAMARSEAVRWTFAAFSIMSYVVANDVATHDAPPAASG